MYGYTMEIIKFPTILMHAGQKRIMFTVCENVNSFSENNFISVFFVIVVGCFVFGWFYFLRIKTEIAITYLLCYGYTLLYS